MSGRHKGGERRMKGVSVYIEISHGGHEIEFRQDEETGKQGRPGAGAGETKQGGEEGRGSNDKSPRDPWA